MFVVPEEEDTFLVNVGLDALPDETRQEFFAELLELYEERLGACLLESLSEDERDEIDMLLEGSDAQVREWLDAHLPHYASSDLFRDHADGYAHVDDAETRSQFASFTWIRIHRPHWEHIVAHAQRQLLREVRRGLGSTISARERLGERVHPVTVTGSGNGRE